MEAIEDLLSSARQQGVELWLKSGKLNFRFPKTQSEPQAFARIRERKQEVITFLQSLQSDSTPFLPLVRQERGEWIPLSHAQERLWVVEQLGASGAAYHIVSALRAVGALDVAALQASVDQLVERHESLRTRFESVGGRAVQRIDAAGAVRVRTEDVSPLGAEASSRARALVQEEGRRTFDLKSGPLLRVLLVKVSAEEHVLLLMMHHIVSDGWSMGVIVRELSALYAAQVRGVAAALPELPIQYADYAIWQRQWLQGEVLEQQLRYWRERLAGAPVALELPTDRQRPAVASYRGAALRFELSAQLCSSLKELAQRRGATLYMVLLAGFQLLLSRYSGQREVVVGSPIAGRARRETEGLIGFFVNTLALRTDLGGDPSFEELIERVKEVALGAYAHQDLPLEKLVSELKPPRDLSRQPIFQVMFALQNVPFEPPADPAQLQMQGLSLELAAAKFDLSMNLQEAGGALRGTLEYATDLFERASIEQMAQGFQLLLEQVVTAERRPIDSLTLPPPRGTFHREPVPAADAPAVEYVAARTALEEKLVLLWQDLLKVDRLGIHDNFFVLGGHSLLGMILIARVQESIKVDLSLRDLFDHPTIEKLADRIVASDLSLPAAQPLVRQERGEWIPLSHAQERLWVVEQLGASGAAYHIVSALRAVGALDVAALQASVDQLVERHESLRTRFESVGGRAVQRIDAAGAVRVRTEDVSPLGAEASSRARALVQEEGRRTFDLKSGPLLRVLLVKVSAEEHVLLLMMHHIVSDGWSMGVIVRELSALYAAQVRGVAAALPELPIQYADYAIWQRQWLQGEVLEQQLRYWRERLAGAPVALELPTDRQRPAVASYRGAALRFELSAQLCSSLKELAQRRGATLYMVLLAGFQLLLSRYSGQREVVVGSPIAGRARRETEGLIGFFVNTLALRTDLGGDPSFEELIERVKEVALGAYAHQDLPLEKLVSELKPPRDLSRQPIFQVMFALQNVPFEPPADPAQLQMQGLSLELAAAKFDLSMNLQEAGGALRGTLEYATDLFERASIEQMAQGFQLLLEQVVTAERRPIDSLTLPPPRGTFHREPVPAADAPAVEYVAARTALEEKLVLLWQDLLKVDRLGIHDNFFVLGGHSLLGMILIARVQESIKVDLSLRDLFDHPTIEKLADRIVASDLSLPAAQPLVRQERGEWIPLSHAQERLWVVEQLGASGAAYHIVSALRAVGALDVAALQASVDQLVERHESLRTRFESVGGRAVQRIDAAGAVRVRTEDVSPLGAEASSRARALVQEEGRRTFDLKSGPLLRVLLVKVSAEEHVLLLMMHHIVSDGWSMGVIVRELSALYAAQVRGVAAALPELPIQYADYAIWQRQWLQGEVLEQQLRYWRERLAGAPVALELPTDRQRPAVASYRGAALRFELSAQLCSSLKELAQRRGATLYMVLLAGFQLLLSRYSGQREVVVGSPIAGRARRETEGLIGFFVNTLALRTDLGGDPSFEELIERVKEVALGAYAHQDLPLEKLVSELKPPRDLSRQPIFQVMFALQNVPFEPPADPAQLQMQGLSLELAAAKFDLSMNLQEAGGALRGTLEYATDLFERASIEQMAQGFQLLLEQVVTAERRPIDSLTLPPPRGTFHREPVPAADAPAVEYVAARTALEEKLVLLWQDLLKVDRLGIHDNFFVLGGHSLLGMILIANIQQALKIELTLRVLFESPTICKLATHISRPTQDRSQQDATLEEEEVGTI